jgi:putative heme-binding domain-containing protein
VSLLEPSKTIALGFEQAIVETTGGETFVGAQRQETNETLTLVGADGQPHVVKKSEIKSRKAIEQSLMPPGLTLALKAQDVADLLAFLEQQRGQ